MTATFQAASQGRLVYWAVTRLYLSPRLPAVQRPNANFLPFAFALRDFVAEGQSQIQVSLQADTSTVGRMTIVKSNPLPFILPPQAV